MDRHEINIENFSGFWDESPLTTDEQIFLSQNKVSEHVIRERRNYLHRSLIHEELIILEILELNGILFHDEYFKPFIGKH